MDARFSPGGATEAQTLTTTARPSKLSRRRSWRATAWKKSAEIPLGILIRVERPHDREQHANLIETLLLGDVRVRAKADLQQGTALAAHHDPHERRRVARPLLITRERDPLASRQTYDDLLLIERVGDDMRVIDAPGLHFDAASISAQMP